MRPEETKTSESGIRLSTGVDVEDSRPQDSSVAKTVTSIVTQTQVDDKLKPVDELKEEFFTNRQYEFQWICVMSKNYFFIATKGGYLFYFQLNSKGESSLINSLHISKRIVGIKNLILSPKDEDYLGVVAIYPHNLVSNQTNGFRKAGQ